MKAKLLGCLTCLLTGLFVGACDAPATQKPRATEDKVEAPRVAQTVALRAAEAASKVDGVATVLNPEPLLQLDADLAAAKIAVDFSRAQFARFKLAPTLSRQVLETAERQAGVDATQQKLLETRLQHTWGKNAPFLNADDRKKLISDLGAGERAIVRLDFPDLAGQSPSNVRVTPLFGGEETPITTLWAAPSGNQSMPGVAYFGLITPAPGLQPGDRARLVAENAERSVGVVIPSAAIVVYAGESWCFVETESKIYERRHVVLDHPVDDGYLVKSGFDVGTRVVVRGASVLLSREARPGDDEDDDGPRPPQKRQDAKPDHSAAAAIQGEPDGEQRADPN